jgi:putative ABC transport system permease protein
MPIYLSIKEIWRNKGRFLLFSLVIALITVLVLFIAGLAEGLASANREYLSKIDAELLVFQENADLSTTSSRLGRTVLNDIRRVPGVSEVGPIGFSNAKLLLPAGEDQDVAMIGVEANLPGSPAVMEGRGLRSIRGNEVVMDRVLAAEKDLAVGDEIVIRTVQGTEERDFSLQIVGLADGSQYFFQRSIFLPLRTWDRMRPQAAGGIGQGELIANVVAVQIDNPDDWQQMAALIENSVADVEAADKVTAYEAAPGYQEQQSTLNTQRAFSLLIGVLVIGGFFQIQTLQKVPQIGMLKAIGTGSGTVALAVILQIVLVTLFGVGLGAVTSLALAAGIPNNVPVIFTGSSAALAVASLLIIGPVGGIVSVRLALKVEPLQALGM